MMIKYVDLMLSCKEHKEIQKLCKENRVTPLKSIDLDSHEKEIEIDDYDDDELLYKIVVDLEGTGRDRLVPYAELLKYDDDMEYWDTIDGDDPVDTTDMCGNYYLNDSDEDICFILKVTSEPVKEEQPDDWLEEETA